MTKNEQIFRILSVLSLGLVLGLAVNSVRDIVTPDSIGSFIHDLESVEVANRMNLSRPAESQAFSIESQIDEKTGRTHIDPSEILSHQTK